MEFQDPRRAAERLRMACDLLDLGVAMLRARLARERPELTGGEIDRRVGEWLQERPGAESGDAEGRSVGWPRPGSKASAEEPR